MDDPQILLALLEKLNSNQQAFLRARVNAHTDKEALDETQLSRSILITWKHDENFQQAYYLVTSPRKTEVEIITDMEWDIKTQKEADTRIRGELMKLSSALPAVFRRLFSIALNGRDTDSIKAIDLLAQMFNLKEGVLSRAQLTLVQQNIVQWTKTVPVEELNAPYRDDSEQPFEATFREMPGVPEAE